ncbi:MFS transporter [Lentisphaera marina]|uniref:MFS transporter n=1 Tax=Lentisphaera marina TaxID=1111041 RepID=UPI002366A690|nr:MFS transporter [Lentisphaera marina]MDD7986300.1 MFS transporter [Lentisphaera marina]
MTKKLKFDQLLAYGAGGIVPIALFNITGQLMGLMGNISLGLSAILMGFIMLIPRLWDAFSDPVMGYISDNHKSPKGRRRPFILYGGIAVGISFVLMWWVPRGEEFQGMFPSDAAFQWFQLAYILVFLLIFYTSCTVFEIPHGALGMELSHDPDERTRLFSAKSFMGNLFAMGTPWLFFLANLEFFKGTGNEIDGMRYVSLLVALIVIPLTFWSYKALKEPKIVNKSKSQLKLGFFQESKKTWQNKTFVKLIFIVFSLAMGFNFVGLLGYYIPIYYIFSADKEAAGALLGFNGMLWGFTGLLAVFPLNMITHKLGKKSTLFIAIIIMIFAQISKIFCYNPNHPYLIVIPTIILSIGMSFFFTLGAAMVGDVCDENTVKTGQAHQGSYYSIYWWFIKLGTAFASIITGFLINSIDFDETQIQKAEAITKSIREIKTVKEFDEDTLLKIKNTIKAFKTHIQENDSKNKDTLIKDLNLIETGISQKYSTELYEKLELTSKKLAQQSSHTLLWMRVVEIALPIILCLISAFICLIYPLGKKEVLKIKAQLDQEPTEA